MLPDPINTDSRDGKRSRSDSDPSTSPTGDATTGNSERPPSQPPRSKRTHCHDSSASTSATPTVPNPRTDPACDSSRDCLCLVCRKIGHVVEKCPLYIWQREHLGSTLPPDLEATRPSPPFNPFPTIEGSTQALCLRCSHMDSFSKIASYRPLVFEDTVGNHSKRATKKIAQIPSLGPIRSLLLFSTCSLCRLIFDSSYLTNEDMEIVRDGGELVVITVWTIHCLENRLSWSGYIRGKGPYAKCVHTSVATWSDGICESVPLVKDAMGAIGLIDFGERQLNGGPALGVRQVDPTTPNYCMVKDWLRRCDDLHHTTCRPFISEDLKQIKLVDVETRQIVMYPPDGCDYIALSYVWGGVEQPSYKLGEILPTVPATLEDAMVVTRHLGKRYLWADSLCIDQENSVEKAIQIALMSTIYSGAWATIICLSGRSARSGLPRVGTLQGVVPQLSCEIRGKRLLSVMPTLSQQISWSPWVSRAWTFQEGLLSPRRLFFTNHQIYFECNSVQCCESLDDSHSPFHLASDEQRRAALDAVPQDSLMGPEDAIGEGVLRDPFRHISSDVEAQFSTDDFERYLTLVHSYTNKKMTHDADSLNAFSAMLMQLAETYYKDGFVQGLPVKDLPRALLWFHPTLPRRRVDFPAWSWAGWAGGVNDVVVSGANIPDVEVMPPLRIWKAGYDERPELVYNFNPTPNIIEALEKADDDEDIDSWEDIKDSDSSLDSESGYDSDEINEGRDAVARNVNDSSHWTIVRLR
jgi:hypothetical protein